MLSDEQCEHLRSALVELSVRLSELFNWIDEENDDASASLIDAWRQFNVLARIVAPELVAAVDEDDELEGD